MSELISKSSGSSNSASSTSSRGSVTSVNPLHNIVPFRAVNPELVPMVQSYGPGIVKELVISYNYYKRAKAEASGEDARRDYDRRLQEVTELLAEVFGCYPMVSPELRSSMDLQCLWNFTRKARLSPFFISLF